MIKVVIFLLPFIPQSLQAQASKFSAGGGVIYGDEIREPGINLRTYYNFQEGKVCFGPEFTRFATHRFTEDGERAKADLYEVNLNGHFLFHFNHQAAFYPVAGLNYSLENERIDGQPTRTADAFGLNLGAGFHFELSHKFIGYIEFDRLISDLGENSITTGILINLFHRKTHETEHLGE